MGLKDLFKINEATVTPSSPDKISVTFDMYDLTVLNQLMFDITEGRIDVPEESRLSHGDEESYPRIAAACEAALGKFMGGNHGDEQLSAYWDRNPDKLNK